MYIYDQTYAEVDYSVGYIYPEIVEFIAEYTGVYYLCVEPYDIPYIPYYSISTRVTPDEPPRIEDVTHFPSNPETSETITVTCSVEDNMGIASVELWYNATNGGTSIIMNHMGGGIYQADIPYQIGAMSVLYYISAEDIYEHVSSTDYYTVIYIQEEPEPTETTSETTTPTETTSETTTSTDEIEFNNLILTGLIFLIITIVIRKRK